MKPYAVYQCLEGEPMTERDFTEAGSKFWNEGKWDYFVAPLLPDDCRGMTFIDMGCNAGLFLKLAEERGFMDVIGVDSNDEAIQRGLAWRDKRGGTYKILKFGLESCIDELPMADFTLLANSHYYFTVNDWLDYIDKLQYKTRNVIIVTTEKSNKNRCWAPADVPTLRSCFKNWDEVGFVDALPTVGDPSPRKLWSLCFKSRFIDRARISDLDSSNHVQDGFYGELDSGKEYHDTKYYRILLKYRAKWGQRRLDRWVEERIRVYESIKEKGLQKAIIVGEQNHILDGNHRYAMMRTLGDQDIFVRRI